LREPAADGVLTNFGYSVPFIYGKKSAYQAEKELWEKLAGMTILLIRDKQDTTPPHVVVFTVPDKVAPSF
jgi:hypothetical protein